MDLYDRRRLRLQLIAVAAIIIFQEYLDSYVDRAPCMTSEFIGDKWVGELLVGHPVQFHNMFRMSKQIFLDLLEELQSFHCFHGSSRTTPREVLGISLYILSHNESIRSTSERFQHSTETIGRYFGMCLDVLFSLASKVIQPIDREFTNIPNEIRHDPRYMPFFKDCIGAIDGTHIDARVSEEYKVAYIGRSGSPTQNVMAACDFNMCFTFVLAGWEGSAHDSRLFQHATRNPDHRFPLPPPGRYYLVDAGYPLVRGFLKPFPDTKYHLPDFARSGNSPRGRKEIFNKRHSSLRGVIERTFGVWKKKWSILRDMPSYSFQKQVRIVIATMALHNFIRRHSSREDIEFDEADVNENLYVGEDISNDDIEENSIEDDYNILTSQDEAGSIEMKILREDITDLLCKKT